MPSADQDVARILAAVGRAAAEARLAVWLVGGVVRDLELGCSPKDVDVAVEAPAERALVLADLLGGLPGWGGVTSHARFGTATVRAPDQRRVDLASTRTELYPRPGALPVVTTGAPLLDDLRRRDFTIHAMARGLSGDGSPGPLIDPFGGLGDLRERRLRLLHRDSLADDPTRALRAVVYAVRLGFGVDREFRAALGRARRVSAFDAVSGDRLRRGLEVVLAEEDVFAARSLLLRLGLLEDLCRGWGESLEREILHVRRGEESRGGGVGDIATARWSSLLAGLSPSKKKEVAERLKFSRALRRAAGVPIR